MAETKTKKTRRSPAQQTLTALVNIPGRMVGSVGRIERGTEFKTSKANAATLRSLNYAE